MSRCRPSQWLLGLVPVAFVTVLIFLGLRGHIEKDLEKRSADALDKASIAWATAQFDGRDGFLSGTAENKFEQASAIGIVGNVWGVGAVHDKAQLIASVSPYVWWASLEENVVKLKGFVPSRSYRRTILGIVKANMAELTVDDRMKLADGSPAKDLWLGAVSFALNQLGRLKVGSKARLEDTSLSIFGEARSAADYQEVKLALRSRLPRGLELKQDAVTPPRIRPFAWRAEYRNGVLTLTGFVPGEKTRKSVMQSAKTYFPARSVSDRMELGWGAPEGWEQAVTNILSQLHRLHWGVAVLSDTELTIEGKAADAETAADVGSKVRQGLPAIYQSEEEIGSSRTETAPSKKKAGSRQKTDRTFTEPPRSDLAVAHSMGFGLAFAGKVDWYRAGDPKIQASVGSSH